MKKILKWLQKIDVLVLTMLMLVFLICVSVYETDLIMKSCCTVFAIPVFLFLLQTAMKRKLENNSYNIDVYIIDNIQGEIVWNRRDDNANDGVFLKIVNTGQIDIFSLYIKVKGDNGAVSRLQLTELLSVNKYFFVRVPYKREYIREIAITSKMQIDCRTKKFSGTQTGNGKEYIFSNIQNYDSEKHAVFHEDSNDKFEILERFWM